MRKLCLVIAYILFPLWAEAAGISTLAFTELYGMQLAESKPARLSVLNGGKALVLFWRSDCPPCLREVALLPTIIKENPDMHIALISLQDADHARHYLTAMPEDVHVLVAKGDGAEVLKAFGNKEPALPFSVALHANGSICERHYGIMGTDIVKKWAEIC